MSPRKSLPVLAPLLWHSEVMTRVTESLSTQLPDTFDHARARVEDTFDETAAYLEETAARIKESEAADNARRIAAVVATSVARGAGQVGLFLGRQAKSSPRRASSAQRLSLRSPRNAPRSLAAASASRCSSSPVLR